MTEWRCIVCNYTSTAEEPPEKCPVCGVDQSKFVPVEEELETAAADGRETAETPAGAPEGAGAPDSPAGSEPSGGRAPAQEDVAPASKPQTPGEIPSFIANAMRTVKEQLVKRRGHPISAHLPNGVLPAAVILLFLGLVFGRVALQDAAFYNLVLVVISMPVVIASGYLDWKAHYGGVYTPLIVTKIVCAVIVSVFGLVLVLWGAFSETYSWPYFLVHLIVLGAAGVAGYMGGKLVFGNNVRPPKKATEK